MPDKFAKRVLAGHTFHLLCMGKLVLGEGAKSHSQDFAVEAVLAFEVVVDSGLVDPCLGNNGADTGFLIAAIRNSRSAALRIRSRVMSDGRVISLDPLFKPSFENYW